MAEQERPGGNEISLSDLIGFAAGENPAEFQTAYNKLMIGRTADVLQGAREVIAKQIIAPGEQDLEDLDSESEGEDDDLDGNEEEELDDNEQASAGTQG